MKIVLLLLFVIPACVFGGGPWTQPANRGYGQLSFTGIPSYDRLYTNDDVGITLNRDVSDVTLLGYFEFGLTDKLTLIGHFPYKIVKTADDINPGGDFTHTLAAGSLSGLGNLAIAGKLNVVKGAVLFSGQVRIDANTVREESESGLRTGYSAWGFTPSIIVGGGRQQFYGFIEAGARLRTDDYSNDLVANFEAGYLFLGRLWLAGVLDILQSISEGTRLPDGSEQTGLYADRQEFFAYGVKLILEISDSWGVNASSFSATSGNLVPKSSPFTVGLYYEW